MKRLLLIGALLVWACGILIFALSETAEPTGFFLVRPASTVPEPEEPLLLTPEKEWESHCDGDIAAVEHDPACRSRSI